MELATLVHIHRPVIENIVFIDSMCNAGIYQNGYLCSAMEILLVFQDIIKAYNPTQKFHMILNDRNSARIDSTKWIFEKLINPENKGRIILHTSTSDVNCFLESPILQKHGISVHNRNTAITLFVDPYNFSTANIGSIKKFCNNNYADLFFNLFTSDFNRNKRIYKDKIDQLNLAKDSSI